MHLYHKRIREFCPTTRKGQDEDEMSEMILDNLASTLKPGDILYNLGDFCFRSQESVEKSLKRIQSMGIEHHLILGNHDHHIRKHSHLQSLCTSVDKFKTMYFGKQLVTMCHFPLGQWENQQKGAWSLHGHCHGGYSALGKILDVGIDNRDGDMMPFHFDEVKQHMDSQPLTKHHEGDEL